MNYDKQQLEKAHRDMQNIVAIARANPERLDLTPTKEEAEFHSGHLTPEQETLLRNRAHIKDIVDKADENPERLDLTPTEEEAEYYGRKRMFSLAILLTIFSNMMRSHRRY